MTADRDLPPAVAVAETRLADAMLAGDVATLDELIADDLVFVDQGGRVLDKGADLAAHRSRRLVLTRLDRSAPVVRSGVDTVLVVVRADLAGTWDGTPFAGTFRYSRLWQRQAGAWPPPIAAPSPTDRLRPGARRGSIRGSIVRRTLGVS